MKKIILSSIVFSLFIALGFSAVFATPNANNDNFVDVIVTFEQVPERVEQEIFKKFGGEIKHSFTIIPAIAGSLPEKAVGALERNPQVVSIDPDLPVYAVGYESSDEYGNTWGVTHIKADGAHQEDFLGESVKVAVIDSGVDYTHRNLSKRFVSNDLGFDFVENNDDPMDVYGHGTHVAGTVAATKDSFGVVGVAPEVQLISLRILNDDGVGSSSNTVAALQWIMDYNESNSDNPIRITNNSYGRGTESGPVRDAFDASAKAGVLHIAAAGNSGNRGGRNDSVIYPAKYESVVAVSAVDKDNRRPSWSSTGPDVELAAPGVSVLSAWNSSASYANPQPFSFDEDEDAYYKEGSGTSMSSPHVAGVAALVWAKDLDLTNDKIRSHLRETADDLGNSNHYGYGLVSAYKAATTTVGDLPEDDNGEENGDDEFEDPEEGELSIVKFEVKNTSNPAWTRAEIAWAVEGNELERVELEIRKNGEIVESKTITVSGFEAEGVDELRSRDDGNFVAITVYDKDGHITEEKSLQ